MVHLLELFSGTGSVGKVARKLGWSVVSVDNDSRFEATHNVDLLKWDYEKTPTPDFIWASPPCTTFSLAATWYRHRDPKTGEALTADAKLADRLLARTLRIIEYFGKINPNLKVCIENPRGYMRKKKSLSKFFRTTTSYNQYKWPIVKPTDFWSNFPLNLKPVDHSVGETISVQSMWSTGDRAAYVGQIPPMLVRQILKQSGLPIKNATKSPEKKKS